MGLALGRGVVVVVLSLQFECFYVVCTAHGQVLETALEVTALSLVRNEAWAAVRRVRFHRHHRNNF